MFPAPISKTLYGLLEAAYALRHDKIDRSAADHRRYEGFDWADACRSNDRFDGKAHALRAYRDDMRVVGEPVWMRTVIGIFGPLTSVETRRFDADDEAAGWEWIGGKPVDSG